MTGLESLAAWTAEAGSHLSGPDQMSWLARIEARYPEINTALHGCSSFTGPQLETGLRIVINLEEFWSLSHRISHGRYLMNAMLPNCKSPTLIRADALLHSSSRESRRVEGLAPPLVI